VTQTVRKRCRLGVCESKEYLPQPSSKLGRKIQESSRKKESDKGEFSLHKRNGAYGGFPEGRSVLRELTGECLGRSPTDRGRSANFERIRKKTTPHLTKYLKNRILSIVLKDVGWESGQGYDTRGPQLLQGGFEKKGTRRKRGTKKNEKGVIDKIPRKLRRQKKAGQ